MGPRANGHRAAHRRRAAVALAGAVCAVGLTATTAAPALADTNVPLNNGQCNFGADNIKETPWSLQRLLTKQMWAYGKGEGVKVAVIDTGVDAGNKQVKPALASAGQSFTGGKATEDQVGHGTKVAGIIAAQQVPDSGFYGIAPGAKILPLQQTDKEKGGTAENLAKAIDAAVKAGVDIINISQGTAADPRFLPTLRQAVDKAEQAGVLIVASAGNGGADGGEKEMYPAAFPNSNVMAVAASDRNNERAPFSQAGSFVDIAAPGVDMVSTVPKGGNCVDQGTSFAAPYAAGAAALLIGRNKAQHQEWKPSEVIWHLEKTAERVRKNRDHNIGWGVVDPVAALNDNTKPTAEPKPDTNSNPAGTGANIQPAVLTIGESPEERQTRIAIYIIGGGALAVAAVVGTSIALRDWRRKTGIRTHGEA
ncbi:MULTISPECIES: type VII secretion-associated serine protease mycosin [Streptomyces]|uniref:type VII secretion-associated serine protease mycosin n=1 Tax=Streptomyces TaxID=1883 RepID=UPI00030333D6|nr:MULTISPECIES: type VII secretion-associated serine protease mycosin [Streptomyces]KEF04194.1 peptidase S8 [Streptomyces rimosus]KEF21747.1 peptidase S8 [Streptomyces rimosus]KOG73888.1 peptidase S8 [Kitasatospora aureofaciens]KUJ40668.1 type VII secretion-associated serine protease mycosin [Streptomyces rimosus subsp. rimosus]